MERRNPEFEFILFLRPFFSLFVFVHTYFNRIVEKAGFFFSGSRRKWSFSSLFLLAYSIVSFGQIDGDYQTRATGNWNDFNAWQVRNGGAWVNCVAGDYPGAAVGAGTVNILNGHTVTLTASPASPIGALTFAPGNIALSSVVFGGAWTLDISGAVTYTLPGANNNGDQTLSVATGILNCASVTMVTTTDNARIQTLSLSTGLLM